MIYQILDGVPVYAARARMGEKLAHLLASYLTEHEQDKAFMDIDVVIPIPETSRTAALQCAQLLQKPYREVGRLFMFSINHLQHLAFFSIETALAFPY